jgi:hypothetical protein
MKFLLFKILLKLPRIQNETMYVPDKFHPKQTI